MASKKTAAKKMAPPKKKSGVVDGATVRMYRLGTGDCFVIKFFAGKAEKFTMMIDCGAWQGSKAALTPYVTDLKAHVKNKVDVLVVTHEHKDHVLGFEACKELFTNEFEVGETWMAWAEEDSDSVVKKWKTDYGKRKMALAVAANRFKDAIDDMGLQEGQEGIRAMHRGEETLKSYRHFGDVLDQFTDLQMAAKAGQYIGPLEGMKIVKEKIAVKNGRPNIRYHKPGNVMENIPGLEGIRIYVLGPPQNQKAISMEESSEEGETYDHNKELAKGGAFAAAVTALDAGERSGSLLPFEERFEAAPGNPVVQSYNNESQEWRRIDHDWLMSAGSLALRLNTGINNLSLALAIEFVESGRVMLFPGDAEFGSWDSWHKISWDRDGNGKTADGKPKHLTEDLLNRTVFYKVAHHLSHNGTAKRKGLEMMTHKDLAAMATLDYGVISNGWTGTMPNQGIIKELLTKTKGRLMIMRTNGLYYNARKTISLAPKIEKAREEMTSAEAKAFAAAHSIPKDSDLFIEYRVQG